MKNVIELFQAARRVSTPLVAFSTSDQFALARRLYRAVGNGGAPTPKLEHDIIRGLHPVNEAAKEMLAGFDQAELMNAAAPAGMLALAEKFVEGTLVVMYNAHRYVDDAAVAQGILNLRDAYKRDYRTLALLGPSFQFRAELQDIVLLDEELPDDEQLSGVMSRLLTDMGDEYEGSREIAPEYVDAVRGLSAFTSEQVFAMSLTKAGVEVDDLWERKRGSINQTQGLEFVRGGPTFDSLGGLTAWKDFMLKLKQKPNVIVFADEIEKQMAGTENDTSGVSSDYHSQMLQWMQDRNYTGIIAVGPPGSGKTAAGMAIGPELDRPTIRFDINALKGQFVGQSERAMRDALKVIDSVAGEGGAFVFATCNSEASLSPEFKRRFWMGEWFFDLPTQEERDVIWGIHLDAFGVACQDHPDDSDWTGAEIRNCCALARQLGEPLVEAAKYIVPVAKASGDRINALREAAFGKWLSASYPGPYKGVRDSREHDEFDNEVYRKVRLAG